MGASEEEEMQAMGLVVAVVVVAASVLEAMQGMGVEGGPHLLNHNRACAA